MLLRSALLLANGSCILRLLSESRVNYATTMTSHAFLNALRALQCDVDERVDMQRHQVRALRLSYSYTSQSCKPTYCAHTASPSGPRAVCGTSACMP